MIGAGRSLSLAPGLCVRGLCGVERGGRAEAAPEEEGEGGEVDASGLREEDIEFRLREEDIRISFLRHNQKTFEFHF